MRRSLVILVIFLLAERSAPAQFAVPSKEAFVNAVFRNMVDGSFSRYYLSNEARPCSFVKYDYTEWLKYALQETVSVDVLDDLARSSYYDRKAAFWQQDSLKLAVCIPEGRCDSLLGPVPQRGNTPGGEEAPADKKKNRQLQRAWARLPVQDRTVFYFSRPEFTDDGRYAIIDLTMRCDARQCGMGTTCLFKQTAGGWKLIGRKVNWGG